MGRPPIGMKAMTSTERSQRRRAAMQQNATKPEATISATELDALRQEIADLRAKLAVALTLRWSYLDGGAGRVFGLASTLTGDYAVHWTATNRPRSRGEKSPL